jgi:pyridinium-3,5-bisthiocarboxylic acid mononucleotide nickel chelatase
MKIAYFDCFSGISGDMTLGALLDAGLPEKFLVSELKKLPIAGYSIDIRREMRGAIAGTRIRVSAQDQPHRSFRDITGLIRESRLSDRVRTASLEAFQHLAEAEARVHNVAVSEVHFHEVGAVDSIIDIVGTTIGLEYLQVDEVHASRLPLGGGLVATAHGLLPVPAPAVVHLLEGVPVYDSGIQRELVTPTGAALLKSLAEGYGTVPSMTLDACGYGVGGHPSSSPPNLLRILLGNSVQPHETRDLLMVETNIDDMSPEIFGYVVERLMALGALDVTLTSVQMKKNRPGVLLSVLTETFLQEQVVNFLFNETTTLGVRIHEVRRVQLPRQETTLETPYGVYPAKRVQMRSGQFRVIPEYESCKSIASNHNIPLRQVYEELLLLAGKM